MHSMKCIFTKMYEARNYVCIQLVIRRGKCEDMNTVKLQHLSRLWNPPLEKNGGRTKVFNYRLVSK